MQMFKCFQATFAIFQSICFNLSSHWWSRWQNVMRCSFTEETCQLVEDNKNIDAGKINDDKNLTRQLTAAVYTLCALNDRPLLSHTIFPHPMLPTSNVLHNCGDSCQDPAGSSDALSPCISCGALSGYVARRGTYWSTNGQGCYWAT